MRHILAFTIPLISQVSLLVAQPVTDYPPSGPPRRAYEALYFQDGSNNIIYICTAAGQSVQSVFAITAANSRPTLGNGNAPANLTSIVTNGTVGTVTTDANHGMQVGQRFTIVGATTVPAMNATYTVATVPSGTTFTYATVVAASTYTDSTMYIATTAPRSNIPVWSIVRNFYTGTNINRQTWARDTSAMTFSCDDRVSYWQ